MRKLPLLLALATVTAVGLSMQGDYTLAARQAQIQQTPSAEVHRQHASNAATMQRALEQPSLQPFTAPSAPVRWTFDDPRPRVL